MSLGLGTGTPNESMQKLCIGNRPGGHYVFAKELIEKGEEICYLRGILMEQPSRYSVQIGPETHLAPHHESSLADGELPSPWIYTNHSCRPNSMLRGRELIAIRAIAAGDEITFDYETTEWDMAEPFPCLCGSPECRGMIRGFVHTDEATRKKLMPYLADYILQEIAPAEAGSIP